MDTIGKRFHLNFLGYEHWFMYIRISQPKDFSILVDQDRHATYAVAKYLETAIIILTKEYASNSYEQVELLFIEYNSHYRACVGSLTYIYLQECICVL